MMGRSKVRVMAEGAVFLTVQGEGALLGVPSTFLRLAGCDLRCRPSAIGGWSCDTPRSLPDFNPRKGAFRVLPTRFAEDVDIEVLAARVYHRLLRHLVVTGGEPTLQGDGLASLIRALNEIRAWEQGERAGEEGLLELPLVHVTVETNGRHYVPELARTVGLLSLSPKIYQPETVRFDMLEAWLRNSAGSVQLKLVLTDGEVPDFALQLYSFVRQLRPDAHLYAQQAAVPRPVVATKLVDQVAHNKHMRILGVRYGVQMHKVAGVP
jgi:7-carboxy-7-deazaguanine synthase